MMLVLSEIALFRFLSILLIIISSSLGHATDCGLGPSIRRVLSEEVSAPLNTTVFTRVSDTSSHEYFVRELNHAGFDAVNNKIIVFRDSEGVERSAQILGRVVDSQGEMSLRVNILNETTQRFEQRVLSMEEYARVGLASSMTESEFRYALNLPQRLITDLNEGRNFEETAVMLTRSNGSEFAARVIDVENHSDPVQRRLVLAGLDSSGNERVIRVPNNQLQRLRYLSPEEEMEYFAYERGLTPVARRTLATSRTASVDISAGQAVTARLNQPSGLRFFNGEELLAIPDFKVGESYTVIRRPNGAIIVGRNIAGKNNQIGGSMSHVALGDIDKATPGHDEFIYIHAGSMTVTPDGRILISGHSNKESLLTGALMIEKGLKDIYGDVFRIELHGERIPRTIPLE